jgi:hypothetical protein
MNAVSGNWLYEKVGSRKYAQAHVEVSAGDDFKIQSAGSTSYYEHRSRHSRYTQGPDMVSHCLSHFPLIPIDDSGLD